MVFDWDRFSTDDKLGFANLNLEPMLHKQEHAEVVELSDHGSVSLRLRWVPQSQLGSTKTDLEAALPVIRSQQPQKGAGKVCVHLLVRHVLNPLATPYTHLNPLAQLEPS